MRELTRDQSRIRELIADVMDIPAMRGLDWRLTSSEVYELVWMRLTAAFGTSDPFRSLKDEQNRTALELRPWLKSLVDASPDPFAAAVKLSILGNSMDMIWSEGSAKIEPIVLERLNAPLPEDRVAELKRRVQESRLLAILGDNAGELVFDRLFIEIVRPLTDAEIVFVVRSLPALNDATLADARACGMDEIVQVMENGVEGPLPGTILRRCSDEAANLLREADLIISKGGGNYDSLDEDREIAHKICYMLMCKCLPYRDRFGTELYQPILWL
jgi:hypothetical protein